MIRTWSTSSDLLQPNIEGPQLVPMTRLLKMKQEIVLIQLSIEA